MIRDLKNNIITIFLLSTILCFPVVAYSDSNTESMGTILQLLIPFSAMGYSAYIKDYEGCGQLFKSAGSAALTTEILKNTVREERPNQPEDVSGKTFPSGHTSFAFSGAAYLQRRYGYEFGIPAYMAASYVGYSRVFARKHNWADVIAGAAIGIGFNYLFTTPYMEPCDISIHSDADEVSLSFSFKF